MIKPFKLALLTGRFQNLQDGHVANIQLASQLADMVLVFVGSAQEVGTERNPFPIDFRVRTLTEATMYKALTNVIIHPLDDMTNENDICTEWGDYLLDHASKVTGAKPDLIIYGDDGRDHDPILWFSDEAKVGINFLMRPRNNESVSGTKMRELLVENKYNEWSEQVPVALHRHFHWMRGHLMTIPYYKELITV